MEKYISVVLAIILTLVLFALFIAVCVVCYLGIRDFIEWFKDKVSKRKYQKFLRNKAKEYRRDDV